MSTSHSDDVADHLRLWTCGDTIPRCYQTLGVRWSRCEPCETVRLSEICILQNRLSHCCVASDSLMLKDKTRQTTTVTRRRSLWAHVGSQERNMSLVSETCCQGIQGGPPTAVWVAMEMASQRRSKPMLTLEIKAGAWPL